MKIEVFGPGCAKCANLEKLVKDTLKEMNIEAEVAKVTDINEMVSRGVMLTPALFIDGKKKSEGKVPSKEEITVWLKQVVNQNGQ
ncbi:MAG: hypothetical protein A2297_06150 [Elusimicrobia bacterium RIFOXYB2_FULL_48_7]|nr:MAG: hypothetical protein A2297_06150 [Elusimicrobia bacterium RIFOXYB2_FULL_48_7]